MSDRAFIEPRVLVVAVASVVAAFALSLLLSFSGGERDQASAGADSTSHSALGHLGAYELLGRLGYQVSRAETDSAEAIEAETPGKPALLIVAEPTVDAMMNARLERLYPAKRLLLILPKRDARRDPFHRGWVGASPLTPLAAVARVLKVYVDKGEVARVAKPAAFSWARLRARPTLAGEAQLMTKGALTPLIASEEGVLLGEMRARHQRLLVLSDPDPIENHGIAKGDNAQFLAALIGEMVPRGGRVVFVESIHPGAHGAPAPPSDPFALATQFPYNLAFLQLALGVALLLLATMGRFGAPQRAPRSLSATRTALIGNMARLLDFPGHRAPLLKRYVEMSVRDAGRRLRAPRDLAPAALARWLDGVGAARRVEARCEPLLQESATIAQGDFRRALTLARAIHAWKAEILDGHRRH